MSKFERFLFGIGAAVIINVVGHFVWPEGMFFWGWLAACCYLGITRQYRPSHWGQP